MRCEACVGITGVRAGNRPITGITLITIITADSAAENFTAGMTQNTAVNTMNDAHPSADSV